MATAIFFGSSMGNTESAAEQIAKKLDAEVFNVADSQADKLAEYDNLILGSSTWGIGDLQDDWEGFISDLKAADLNGKTVALFGLGDASSYPDSFVDAMGILYETVTPKGCKIVGAVDTADYDYDASTAEIDGKFVGLALDEDNDSDKTADRIEAWTSALKTELK